MSTLKTINIVHPSGSTTNIVNDSSGNMTVGGTMAMSSSFMRNRIINGAMVIDQRNAGASVTPTDGAYTLDRWRFSLSQASKLTCQQSSTAPTGFATSILITSSSAYTVGASESFLFNQRIEGFNFYDLGWGTADAKTVTLSFWVRSSLTGIFGGSIANSAVNRLYPFSYTISAANTWEQKTVTIAGDTTGTWIGATNGIGASLYFSLGAGASVSGTAGAWSGSTYLSATGATSVVGTNGATFYITGVQLEVGSVATPFEREIYSNTLAKCQRYYQQYGTEAGTYLIGGANGSSRVRTSLPFNVTMRSAPTITVSGTPTFYNYGGANPTYSSVALTQSSTKTFTIDLNTSSGLTAGQVCDIVFTGGSAQVAISAEL